MRSSNGTGNPASKCSAARRVHRIIVRGTLDSRPTTMSPLAWIAPHNRPAIPYDFDMTLRRKMGLQIAAMIVGLLLVSAAALWGLNALHEDYGSAVAGYQELREVYEVGSRLATAKTLILPDHPDRVRARAEAETAAERFEIFIDAADSKNRAPSAKRDVEARLKVKAALADAVRQLATPPERELDTDVLAADAGAISAAIGKIGVLASNIRGAIESHQASAIHRRQVTARTVAGISLAVVIAAIVLGVMQYRDVMGPLAALRIGVRKIAAGQFTQRLAPRGGEEFVELAGEFNAMAGELDGFYHDLEQKVARKSKELIQSERLASVGYLAAGVAHEINNPLGIISGYAEFSLEQIRTHRSTDNGHGPAADARERDIIKSLEIICEEAFRCKDITGKLLSLARQGDENRQNVCLADVADKVVSIIGGLREYRHRRLAVVAPRDAAERDKLIVSAVEAEMKQVVLNLALNALEALPSDGGEVTIDVEADGGFVQLSVSDTGRGMSAQTLERIFEPFFTEKRGSPQAGAVRSHGSGLGLSISYAIVQSHGGSIVAHSDGPGKGSRFVVRLAAATSDGDQKGGSGDRRESDESAKLLRVSS
ncbi:MAG TPA: HAMP domain-containing sensor histidine kinase [Tepidisphaeraceae bacterium]|jgi:signal transduction histidine kinase|nr:HAMP domain-containing sensor histidine kinase [Tepidisphaeraceae bacterium]